MVFVDFFLSNFFALFFSFIAHDQAHIEDLNETQLKSLLDEAMDYKNPRDANDKSDTFKVSPVIASFMSLIANKDRCRLCFSNYLRM